MPVHALTRVMAYPELTPCDVMLRSVSEYMYANRFDGNTFGGELASAPTTEAAISLAPLDTVPSGERLLITDAGWTGSEERSQKAIAIKVMGGTIMHRIGSIHAIMPSSFSAEADALHDGFEMGNYINDGLVEFGLAGSSSFPAICDNEGLVKTAQEKSKGGSKLHRRKLGIILENTRDRRFKVSHVSTHQMPVDFLTKLIANKKVRASIDFLYNLANRALRGVPL